MQGKELIVKKYSLIFLFSLFIQGIWAQGSHCLCQDDQYELIEKMAKSTRHKLQRKGHLYISTSDPEEMTAKETLDSYYENNQTYEVPLDRKSYSFLYACYYKKNCTLWYYSSTSNYRAGTGIMGHFILLDTNTFQYQAIRHHVYIE